MAGLAADLPPEIAAIAPGPAITPLRALDIIRCRGLPGSQKGVKRVCVPADSSLCRIEAAGMASGSIPHLSSGSHETCPCERGMKAFTHAPRFIVVSRLFLFAWGRTSAAFAATRLSVNAEASSAGSSAGLTNADTRTMETIPQDGLKRALVPTLSTGSTDPPSPAPSPSPFVPCT